MKTDIKIFEKMSFAVSSDGTFIKLYNELKNKRNTCNCVLSQEIGNTMFIGDSYWLNETEYNTMIKILKIEDKISDTEYKISNTEGNILFSKFNINLTKKLFKNTIKKYILEQIKQIKQLEYFKDYLNTK